MVRRPRVHFPGASHHVISTGNAEIAHRLDVETSDGRFHATATGYVHSSFETRTYLVFVDLPLEAAPIVVLKKKVPKDNEPVFLIDTKGGSQSGVTPATFGWRSKRFGFYLRGVSRSVKSGALLVTRDGEPIGLFDGVDNCTPSSVLLNLKKDKLRTFEENWRRNKHYVFLHLKAEAEKQIKIQNYADAYRMLKKAEPLTLLPSDSVEINGLLGKCSWNLRKYDEAVVWLQKYIESGEQLAKENRDVILNRQAIKISHRFLAQAYFKLKEYDNALAICNRGIKHYGADEFLYAILGEIYSEQGRYEQALSAFQNALQIKNDSFLALSGMGQTYEKMGKVSEAIASYERAVSFAPPGDIQVSIAARLAEIKKKKLKLEGR